VSNQLKVGRVNPVLSTSSFVLVGPPSKASVTARWKGSSTPAIASWPTKTLTGSGKSAV